MPEQMLLDIYKVYTTENGYPGGEYTEPKLIGLYGSEPSALTAIPDTIPTLPRTEWKEWEGHVPFPPGLVIIKASKYAQRGYSDLRNIFLICRESVEFPTWVVQRALSAST
jgi:hypothetical protein